MARTKTTQEAIHRLYALMAAAVAQRAMAKIGWDKPAEAEALAGWAVKWMDKSSAHAVKWHYQNPRMP